MNKKKYKLIIQLYFKISFRIKRTCNFHFVSRGKNSPQYLMSLYAGNEGSDQIKIYFFSGAKLLLG